MLISALSCPAAISIVPVAVTEFPLTSPTTVSPSHAL